MPATLNRERLFRNSGPDAITKTEEEVNKWMKEMEDEIEIDDLREFEDENEHGKLVGVVISYHYLLPPS